MLYISALVGGCGARTPLRSPLLKFNCTEVVQLLLYFIDVQLYFNEYSFQALYSTRGGRIAVRPLL